MCGFVMKGLNIESLNSIHTAIIKIGIAANMLYILYVK